MTDAPLPLAGKVAFVAGATGPVGRAIVYTLAAQGASIAIHYNRSAEKATALAATLDVPHVVVQAPFTDRDAIAAAFATTAATLGPVTILINAAHVDAHPVSVAELSDSVLEGQLDGVRGHAALCGAAIPGMRAAGWGRIVYVSGALMTRPAAGFAAYAAAKAAASTFTRYVALEEGRAGITANIVAPGRVLDPDETAPLDEEFRQLSDQLLARMALGEFPDTHDVAGIVSLLVGPHSAHLTGQTIWVAGGEPIS